MKKIFPLLIIGLMLVGCNSTPAERWAAARQSVSTAQDMTVTLHRNEIIDDDDLLTVDPWLVSAREIVNAMYPFIDEGGPEFRAKLAEVQLLLTKVREVLQQQGIE